MKTKTLTLVTAALLIALSTNSQGWEPYNFNGDEKYEFEITYYDNNEATTGYYGIEMKSTGKTDENGEKLYEVVYTNKGMIPESELGEQTAFGFWSSYGMSLSFVFLNPMYTMLFQQMEFEVGEKMSFFGAGKAEITGKETIAGRNGYVCKYFQKDEEKGDVLVGEWVIDPELGFPLKSIMYDEDEIQSKIELTNYTTY
jgi:hypothetical protein